MKFEEIFNENGLYKADDFQAGVCFKVENDMPLKILIYQSKDDILPLEETAIVYGGLFKKNFVKILTRHSLFK